MRFNATLNVDFAQWKVVKMERENNMKEFRGMDEDMPKFGAGSEYNRDLREEVRRKKFGIIAKKYRPEAQPWILKVGGKSGKKFRGIREGGVGENAAFYVFTHAPDGAIEAYPLNEWYNFQPIQRYKSLSAEEAEHEFGRRKKVLNYFSLMLRKRLKGDDETEEPEEEKIMKAGKSKELKISDMDEWIDSGESSSDEDDDEDKKKDDEGDSDKEKKKKNKKQEEAKKNKKKKKGSDDEEDEPMEESDDGDDEGKELDYISDSSERYNSFFLNLIIFIIKIHKTLRRRFLRFSNSVFSSSSKIFLIFSFGTSKYSLSVHVNRFFSNFFCADLFSICCGCCCKNCS